MRKKIKNSTALIRIVTTSLKTKLVSFVLNVEQLKKIVQSLNCKLHSRIIKIDTDGCYV